MSDSHHELLEIILRECAAAGPSPWYPAHYSQATGVARPPLDASLDRLRLAGLVQLTPWVKGQGQGYALTPEGAEVLQTPRLLGRLRQGEVPEVKRQQVSVPPQRHALEGVRGEKIRNAMLSDARPIITQGLVLTNIAWFIVGMLVYTLRYGGKFQDYLFINPVGDAGGPQILSATYIDIGSLYLPDVLVRHQWWRLLSSSFAHMGLLHLGMNMYALYMFGRMLERMWGRAAFLGIYLVSGLGCGASCVLALTGNALGASGCICGLLGSFATWVFLNRHFLPRQIVTQWRQNIVMNVVMIAVISFLPGVSLAGHLGGGIAGALVAVPLNLAHFGDSKQKWLGWLAAAAAVMVALGCLPFLVGGPESEVTERFRAEVDHADHVQRLESMNRDPTNALLLKGEEIARPAVNAAVPLLAPKRQRPQEEQSKKLLVTFTTAQAKLDEIVAKLAKVSKPVIPEQQAAIKAGLEFFDATSKFSAGMTKVLAADGQWTDQELSVLREQHSQFKRLYDDFTAAWRKMEKAWPSK